MALALALVFFVNATATQGGADGPESHGILFVVMLVCLYASWVTGLVAMFRKRERSWVVLFPTVLISAAVVNELVQGLFVLVSGSE